MWMKWEEAEWTVEYQLTRSRERTEWNDKDKDSNIQQKF